MGFEASLPLDSKKEFSTCTLDIKGMTCNSCVQSIEGNCIYYVAKIIISFNFYFLKL